jgi:ribosomal protein S18 acetylase RimI-like enzyme
MHVLPPATIARIPESRIPDAARLLTFLNPDCPEDVILKRLKTIIAQYPNYQLWAAIRDGKLVGIAGIWLGTKIWCGPYLEIDNLVVHPDYRSRGIGSLLIERLEEIGRQNDCTVLVIDSYTANHASHRLYHKLGFEIWSFHFIRKIGDFTGASDQ